METATILKPETLTLFLYYVVPGFVALQIYDILVPSERRNFGEAIIQIVSYSLMTDALLFWAPLVLASRVRSAPAWLYIISNIILLIVMVLLAPTILAVVVYKLRKAQRGPLRWLLKRLGIEEAIVDPTQTPWDKFFGERQPCYIVFHLKGGETLVGGFGEDSFASRYPEPQQIYVEHLMHVDEVTGVVGDPIENSLGVIIELDECDYIEMYSSATSPTPSAPVSEGSASSAPPEAP